jgi:hypothetical protein
MMLGAIADAGGASCLMFWFIVCSDFDSLIFLFVFSEVL